MQAAGAVLWRPDTESGEPRIAVIHRPAYDDWSIPKGKIDPGETAPVAAVREIFEETGQRAYLGRRVERLSYPLDRKVLGRFLKRPFDTQTVLIVRHGTAGRKARYKGDDRGRPLDTAGRTQAKSLVPQLLAFGAAQIYAGDRVRCRQTVEPLAAQLTVPITAESKLTEEAYARSPKAAHRRVLEIAAEGGTPVICTQGKVIPYLIEWWCARDGVKPDKSRNRKGSTWVLSLQDGRLVAADHIASPLS